MLRAVLHDSTTRSTSTAAAKAVLSGLGLWEIDFRTDAKNDGRHEGALENGIPERVPRLH